MDNLRVQIAPHPLYPYPYQPPSPMSATASSTDSQRTLVDTFVPALGYRPMPRVAQMIRAPDPEPEPTWRDGCCGVLTDVSDILCTCFAWCCGVLCWDLC